MIILNALSKERLYRTDIDTFYKYLSYIKGLHLPDDLLQSLNNIYIPKDNFNPKDCLFDIDTELEKELEFDTFKKLIKK